MVTCETPDLGRVKGVGLFLLDECGRPIYGPGAGYYDSCPANQETSDNLDEGEEFTRRCSDGSIKRYISGESSLQSIEVNVDFHWLDPEWVAQAGGAEPIMHNGQVIGHSDCTKSKFNVLVVIWQEILGEDACSADATQVGCPNYVRLYPLKGARLTDEGGIGAEDSYVRLTGVTTDAAQLGSGPIPLACNPETGEAEWISDCFPTGCHRFKFIGGPAPEVCGAFDLVEPTEPCIPAEESPVVANPQMAA